MRTPKPDLKKLIRASWESAAPEQKLISIGNDLDHLIAEDSAGRRRVVPIGVGADIHFGDSVEAATDGDNMPNPNPSLAERIHQAWNATSPPEQQWIVEAAPDEVIVMDNTDRSLVRVPVTIDDDQISFGPPQKVRPAYVPADDGQVAASRLVFASADESRPAVEPAPPVDPPPSGPPPVHTPAPPADPAPQTDPTPDPADPGPTGNPDPAPDGGDNPTDPPAAEPEPNTEPKGEDPVSTLSNDTRSRLGLPDDADDDAVLAAIDDLKAKADKVNAATAATAATDEMKAEISRLSGELAGIKAAAAADTKKALFEHAVRTGRIKPATRESWEKRYDKAPDVITDILASLAPNTEFPTTAPGYTGQEASAEELEDAEADKLFAYNGKAN
ncbi:phage protease [Micromonospora sp. NPDC006766]|uniref:phage protease n=1 Tax=Micromonospora sp. NPDC006766 TaxID=3154778 RepID=UPI0033EE5754